MTQPGRGEPAGGAELFTSAPHGDFDRYLESWEMTVALKALT